MIKLESRGSFYCRKMVKYQLGWFGHVWRRHVHYIVMRIDQMDGSPIINSREKPRKIT